MLDPHTTAALILGVSDCPKAPSLQPLPQCANSASAFVTYLRERIQISEQNILNLFDSPKYAPEQLEEINAWLQRTAGASRVTDLLIFYTGHAGFSRSDQSYFLAINKTSDVNEGGTSLRYADLALCLKHHAARSRRYIFLDCCYAAAAVPKHQSNLNQLVMLKITDEMPSSGTALLCSSSAKLASIAPKSASYTMFSHSLLRTLYEGIAGGGAFLTLEDVADRARQIVTEDFRDDIVRPELHVPDQQKGNPAAIPLFPNPQGIDRTDAFAPRKRSQGRLIQAFSAIKSGLTTPRLIGLASGIASSILLLKFPYPVGIGTAFPPFGPPLCLSVALYLVLRHVRTTKELLVLIVAVFCGFSLAYEFVFVVIDSGRRSKGNGVFILSYTMASCIGSAIVLSADRRAQWRRSTFKTSVLLIVTLTTPFIFLTLAMVVAGTAANRMSVEIITYSALFAPWQMLMVEFLRAEASVGNMPGWPALAHVPHSFYGTLLALTIAPFAIGDGPLTFINGMISDSPADFTLLGSTLEENSNDYQLTLNIRVVKTTSKYLSCRVQLRDNKTEMPIEGSSDESTHSIYGSFTEITAKFMLPSNENLDLSMREHCEGSLIDFTTKWEELKISPGK